MQPAFHNHVSWGIDAWRADGKAMPKLDLHLQGQVEHNAGSPETRVLLEGEDGNGIPSSILVIPQLWFQVIITPWPRESLASNKQQLLWGAASDIPAFTESNFNRKLRRGEHLRLDGNKYIQI